MRLLLDTHALIWWMDGSLVPEVAALVRDPAVTVVVSAVSLHEISYKVNRGKLSVPGDPLVDVEDSGFESLAITLEHAHRGGALPLHHRDPFDRILIAQAQVEGLTLVTRDRKFSRYDVTTLAC